MTRLKGCLEIGLDSYSNYLDDHYPAPTAAFFVRDREERSDASSKGSFA